MMAFPAQIKSPVLQKVLTLLFKVPGKRPPLSGLTGKNDGIDG